MRVAKLDSDLAPELSSRLRVGLQARTLAPTPTLLQALALGPEPKPEPEPEP